MTTIARSACGQPLTSCRPGRALMTPKTLSFSRLSAISFATSAIDGPGGSAGGVAAAPNSAAAAFGRRGGMIWYCAARLTAAMPSQFCRRSCFRDSASFGSRFDCCGRCDNRSSRPRSGSPAASVSGGTGMNDLGLIEVPGLSEPAAGGVEPAQIAVLQHLARPCDLAAEAVAHRGEPRRIEVAGRIEIGDEDVVDQI